MKFLVTLLSLLSLFSLFSFNTVQAEMGRLESFATPSIEKHDPKIIHLWLQNNCNQEVYVAIKRETPPYHAWETKGHMRIYPGQIIPVGDMTNDIFYLNAFSGDRRIRWEGPHSFEIHGRYVRATLVQLPRDYAGNWTTVLYCY